MRLKNSRLLAFSLLAGLLLFAGCWDRDPFPDAAVDQGADLLLDRGSGDLISDLPPRLDFGPDWGAEAPFDFASLKAGGFSMGSPATELCHTAEEQLHQVTLTRGFRISKTEITQHQFYQLMRYNRANNAGCGPDCPVEGVTWHEAAAFSNAMSKKGNVTPCYACTGSDVAVQCDTAKAFQGGKIYDCPGYRLPTEAEWEYAYRAGTQTPLYNGTTIGCGDTRDAAQYPDPKNDPGIDQNAWAIAWYISSADGQTHPVGQRLANAWGLFDMAGNVWEWVHDWREAYPTTAVTDPAGPDAGFYRVIRGGGIDSMTMYLRGGYRNLHDPSHFDTFTGFRIVQTAK